MESNEATRLCREVWRQLVSSQERIRRVQGKLRESQLKKLRVPPASAGQQKGRVEISLAIKAPEPTEVSRDEADAVKNKILSAVAVRGINDVKSLFKHMRSITEDELHVVVRSKLRLTSAAVTDNEISKMFKFVDQKNKKKIPVTVLSGFLVRDEMPNATGPADLDPLEALRWKRMELARDLERFKENLR